MSAMPSTTPVTDPMPMSRLDKSSMSELMADIRAGRYAAMCCIADPNIRGQLDVWLDKFGLNRTLMILAQACCPRPCSPLATPGA